MKKNAKMKSRLASAQWISLVAAGCIAGVSVPSLATAQSYIESEAYLGGKARVNSSARLRALTEHLASSSCRIAAGVQPETARADLLQVRDDFTRILAGLTNGDQALGIPTAEERHRSLQMLGEVGASLEPMNSAAEQLISGEGTETAANVIKTGREELFEKTFILASEISGQYSNPLELLQADAITLDFAGRQRAMIHKTERLICQLFQDPTNEEARAELTSTIETIENSLVALQNGFPSVGINPPPTEAVQNSLSKAYDLWAEEREILDGIAAGEPASEDAVIKAAEFAISFKKEINNAITLYLIASPGQDGVYRIPLTEYVRSELSTWLSNESILEAVHSQNQRHTDLSEDDIIALDQEWRAEESSGGGTLISGYLENPASEWLVSKQASTSGFVTEVIIMDNKGLNVAVSAVTSDYWQGDEAKWQETYLLGPDALHISEVEFDDSTGYYQTQASMPITDPETGDVIGAVTFGVNIQGLM